MFSNIHPTVIAAMLQAQAQVQAARIQADARAIENVVATTRAEGGKAEAITSKEGTIYGVDAQERISAAEQQTEMAKIMSQLGIAMPSEVVRDKDGEVVYEDAVDENGEPIMELDPETGEMVAKRQPKMTKGQDFGLGTIMQQAEAQKGVEQEMQLGRIASAKEAGKEERLTLADTLAGKLGTGTGEGSYRQMGELAAAQSLQNLSATQQQQRLNEQQASIAANLGNVTNPLMSMFGMQFPGAQQAGSPASMNAEAAAGGLAGASPLSGQAGGLGDVGNMFNLAGQGQPQQAAMGVLQSQTNPFDVNPLISGMVGYGAQGAAAGGDQLNALQGRYNAMNTLNPQASQQFAQTGLQAGQNVGQQFDQQLSNQYAMQQPFAAAAGQMAGAIPQAYGQSLAQLANVS